jgi:hypothetical protein
MKNNWCTVTFSNVWAIGVRYFYYPVRNNKPHHIRFYREAEGPFSVSDDRSARLDACLFVFVFSSGVFAQISDTFQILHF